MTSTSPLFEIEGLRVAADGHEILKGVDLAVGAGELHALMGPNGSGKSTLANALLGSPEYEVTGGRVRYHGDDITDWTPDVRGKAGLFLAFQYPQAIAGVSVINFLRQALSGRKGIDLSVLELRLAIMEPDMAILDETDSGLDIDALRVVAKGVQEVRRARPEMGTLVITHYQRLLDELTPDRVHLLIDGRIVESGGPELAERIENEGFEAWQ